jgi:hypothetical protein
MQLVFLGGKKGGVALVDDEDAELVSTMSWSLCQGYAHGKRNGRNIAMHQLLMGKAPPGLMIDHINRNRLDNRRINLRFVDNRANSENSDRFKGGIHQQPNGSWTAKAFINSRQYNLGTYFDKEDALLAREERLRREPGEDTAVLRRYLKTRRYRRNTYSRHPGVTFYKRNGRWMAYYVVNRGPKYIGSYATEAEAIAAREAFLKEHPAA